MCSSSSAQGTCMSGYELIGSAMVPDGIEMRLVRSEDDYAIMLEDNELMSTDLHASEQALATLTCERLAGRAAPHPRPARHHRDAGRRRPGRRAAGP